MDVATRRFGDEQVRQFERDGFVVVRGLLDGDVTRALLATAKSDPAIVQNGYGVLDAAGRQSRLASWNHPGDDLYGHVSRWSTIVGAMELLLGGEVYHYHSKMMLKEPLVGGAWEWHQDYGYWYQNGCLLPDMASCLIALDAATRANGCLQVLRGSHRMGRVDHGRHGQQTGADPERVAVARARFELVHCELEPGDAVLFHSNLLHASGPNESERPRWSLICCYNAAHNDPYKASHHPGYTKLHPIDDDALRAAAARPVVHDRAFVKPADDRTIGSERGV